MKKGFTISELVISLALISIIGTILVVSVNGLLKNQNNKELNKRIERIESSACTYIVDENIESEVYAGNITTVSINVLIDEGYLENEDIINPVNNKKFNNTEVNIISECENSNCTLDCSFNS